MSKIVIASDSFKGALSSVAISKIFTRTVKEMDPSIEVVSIPVADGGEGTAECFAHCLKGKWIKVKTVDANWNELFADYYLFDDTAIIEVASVIGLPQTRIKNPGITTTYGIGALIKDAIEKGARNIVLGLGGSSTNDGGCGLACSLGVSFNNKEGKEFVPVGDTLSDIDAIDNNSISLKGVKIVGMCDVSNPLYGLNGASYVFGPQKGADDEQVKELDKGLRHLASITNDEMARECGTGAAGGLGFAIKFFLGGELKSGIETILDLINFDEIIKDSSLVVSGEGRLDSQSFSGKTIDGILKRCKRTGVPLVLIVGSSTEGGMNLAKENGVLDIFVATPVDAPIDDVVDNADLYYEDSVKELLNNKIMLL